MSTSGHKDAPAEEQQSSEAEMAALPGNFTRTMDRLQRLAPALAAEPDLAQHVQKRRRELTALLEPFDAICMLGQLVLSELTFMADSYVESEHQGTVYVVEIAAAALLSRPDRHGAREHSPPIDANTLGPARELIGDMALLEGMRRFQHSIEHASEKVLAGAQGNAAISHLVLRGPGWAWQEQELIADLFAPFAEELTTTLGFDASQALACAQATETLVMTQFQEHMHGCAEHVPEALEWGRTVLDGGWEEHPGPARDRAIAGIWGLMHAGEAMLLTSASLAERASVSEPSAAAFMRALSTPFGQDGPLFEVAEDIRFAPFIPVEDRFFPTVPGNALWALRSLFEGILKEERYFRHRGIWLERRANTMLARSLRPDEMYEGVKIIAPDGRTVLGEIDGLLRVGDTVLTPEAKSATMRPGARRGGRALLSHLKATMTKASQQAALTRRVLHGEQPGSLRASDGTPLVLGAQVREVHPLMITLDDISSVGPSVWEIAGSTVLPEGVTAPWMTTLHDLELQLATVENPIVFVHYLRARSRMNQLGGRIATDELDWWMLYLSTSLYFEHEPDPGRLRYLSMTDPLDAWVLYEYGLRETPARKPRLRLDPASRRLLGALARERPPGWMPAGCMLLSVESAVRAQIFQEIVAARQRARERNLVQRGVYGFGEEIQPMIISFVVVPDEESPALLDHLRIRVHELMDEYEIRRMLALGFTSSSKRPFDALIVVEDATWNLPNQPAVAAVAGS